MTTLYHHTTPGVFRSVNTGTLLNLGPDPEEPTDPDTYWEPVSHGSEIGAHNTGIPPGTVLTPYTGPSIITTNGTVIDSVDASTTYFEIRAKDVTIRNSLIMGAAIDENAPEAPESRYSATVENCRADLGNRTGTVLGTKDMTVRRCHITGGNRSLYCYHRVTAIENYIHGQAHGTEGFIDVHASAIRMSQDSTILRNNFTADIPYHEIYGGPSANLTGYGDFEPVVNNLIQDNWMGATEGGYGSYGGYSAKPYQAGNRDVRFIGNIYQRGPAGPNGHRGPTGRNGIWGPITDFNPAMPGNEWTNNRYDDDTPIVP